MATALVLGATAASSDGATLVNLLYDLKEIAFPSSLPDPPHIKKRPKLTWKDKWCILKEATRLYGASWAKEEPGIKTEEGRSEEPTAVEDFLGALKGGAEKAKPVLQRLYMARASNYTDALKNYVESYKEGLKEHLEEEAMGKGRRQGNEATKPPQSPEDQETLMSSL
ncbi:hypothetical protein E2562_011754 [Oryza meyeriana var. granulata]|uniref:Uncharacterized protein n=1 Tax=Oryza meyeriana var. granulata TaxID=110450 RepID=A0A6G1CQ21_9ORYZ|nr:hypothetical protein E2562_011754 [Oryza meyeriana var. granulata]